MSVRFRVDRTNPEQDLEVYALQLGSAIEAERAAKANVGHYFAEANKLRKTIQEYEEILRAVIARDNGAEIETKSRMDPMLTYDAGALSAQLEQMRGQVRQFEEIGRQAMAEAVLQRNLVADASLQIRNIQTKQRNGRS